MRFATMIATRPLEDPLSYLYRIVRNVALDGLRQQVSRDHYLLDESAMAAAATADISPSPEAQALHRQELEFVRAALAELPERTRKAVELHRLEGLKIRAARQAADTVRPSRSRHGARDC